MDYINCHPVEKAIHEIGTAVKDHGEKSPWVDLQKDHRESNPWIDLLDDVWSKPDSRTEGKNPKSEKTEDKTGPDETDRAHMSAQARHIASDIAEHGASFFGKLYQVGGLYEATSDPNKRWNDKDAFEEATKRGKDYLDFLVNQVNIELHKTSPGLALSSNFKTPEKNSPPNDSCRFTLIGEIYVPLDHCAELTLSNISTGAKHTIMTPNKEIVRVKSDGFNWPPVMRTSTAL